MQHLYVALHIDRRMSLLRVCLLFSTQDSYSFLVPEDVGSNSVVAMVTVTDLDTMMRGEVMFDLQRGGDFSVRGRRVDDAQTWVGEITTTTVSGLNSS